MTLTAKVMRDLISVTCEECQSSPTVSQCLSEKFSMNSFVTKQVESLHPCYSCCSSISSLVQFLFSFVLFYVNI